MKKVITFLLTLSPLIFFAQNVGINTESPKTALEVAGGFLVSGQNNVVGAQSGAPLPNRAMLNITYADSSAYLFDSGGPNGNYGNNELITTYIAVPNSKYIQLVAEMFNTESPYDSLVIFNNTTNLKLAKLTGTETTNLMVKGAIRLHFYSNAFNTDEGFRLRWDGVYDNPNPPATIDIGGGGRLEYIQSQSALRNGFVEGAQWEADQVGENSFASGNNANAQGKNAAAIGDNVHADAYGSLAVGRYNVGGGNSDAWNSNDPLLEIGNGTASTPSNALTVYKNGNMSTGGNVAVGGILSGNGSGLTNLPIPPQIWSQSGVNAYYNSGDVGIGTASPDGKFEISANSSLSDPHIKLHENGNDYARINFDNNNGSNYWTIAAYIASNHRNDRLNFWNGTGGDVMTITGDGEVGIGVGISPKVPLHVGNNRRVLFGIDTLGNGDKLMFLPDLHAFRVGTVATGAASTYWNRDSIGLYSFASGYNTRAQGFGATAMGRDTEATNSYAFASGFFSNADGQYSTAMGFNTDALALGSTALGYSTDAEENYSFAAGYFAEAQAIYSVAIGNAVQAQSYAGMAVGRYNVGGGSATVWNANDPIFEIGIGTGPSSTANAMTVQKDGDVGIGTTFPGARLHVADGNLRIGSLEEFLDGGSFLMQCNSAFAPETNGNRTLGTSAFRWSTVYATNGTINTSDARQKENIVDLDYGLNEVMQLRPVKYNWIDQPEMGTKIGLLAQELKEVIGEVVLDKDWIIDEATGEKTEIEAESMGVFYSDLIPVLIKSIQELSAQKDTLEERLDQQQTLINQLIDRVKILEGN